MEGREAMSDEAMRAELERLRALMVEQRRQAEEATEEAQQARSAAVEEAELRRQSEEQARSAYADLNAALSLVDEADSRAAGKSLKQLQLETETGMLVLAIQRGRRWTYRPRPRFELEPGDRVISIGPEEGAAELEALFRAPAAVESS